MAGAPYFAMANPELSDKVNRQIRVALRSEDLRVFCGSSRELSLDQSGFSSD